MRSKNKFMLIVQRLRLTSLYFGRLQKYAFHWPRDEVSLFEKKRGLREPRPVPWSGPACLSMYLVLCAAKDETSVEFMG
jgi:hypothetical protein